MSKKEPELPVNPVSRRTMLSGAALAAVALPTTSALGQAAPPSGIFNIVNYGAVAGGTVDCWSAIQAAINDASSSGGGVVQIPAGRWYVNLKAGSPASRSTVMPYALCVPQSNVAIVGFSRTNTIILIEWDSGTAHGPPGAVCFQGPNFGSIGYPIIANCAIANLEIRAVGSSSIDSFCFAAQGVRNFRANSLFLNALNPSTGAGFYGMGLIDTLVEDIVISAGTTIDFDPIGDQSTANRGYWTTFRNIVATSAHALYPSVNVLVEGFTIATFENVRLIGGHGGFVINGEGPTAPTSSVVLQRCSVTKGGGASEYHLSDDGSGSTRNLVIDNCFFDNSRALAKISGVERLILRQLVHEKAGGQVNRGMSVVPAYPLGQGGIDVTPSRGATISFEGVDTFPESVWSINPAYVQRRVDKSGAVTVAPEYGFYSTQG